MWALAKLGVTGYEGRAYSPCQRWQVCRKPLRGIDTCREVRLQSTLATTRHTLSWPQHWCDRTSVVNSHDSESPARAWRPAVGSTFSSTTVWARDGFLAMLGSARARHDPMLEVHDSRLTEDDVESLPLRKRWQRNRLRLSDICHHYLKPQQPGVVVTWQAVGIWI
jgi:hypothetical protein